MWLYRCNYGHSASVHLLPKVSKSLLMENKLLAYLESESIADAVFHLWKTGIFKNTYSAINSYPSEGNLSIEYS